MPPGTGSTGGGVKGARVKLPLLVPASPAPAAHIAPLAQVIVNDCLLEHDAHREVVAVASRPIISFRFWVLMVRLLDCLTWVKGRRSRKTCRARWSGRRRRGFDRSVRIPEPSGRR